jgi:hypothetical protein
MTIRQANNEDLDAILKLQEKYHVSNLTVLEQQAKGFVTMKVTPEQFLELIAKRGVFIVILDNVLAGYALSSDWHFYRQWAIIKQMEAILPTFTLNDAVLTVDNSFQYGPVCIDEAYRGRNILAYLFKAIERYYAKNYKFSITFINKKNERSLRAHAKQTPLSIVGEFGFNDNEYFALASELVVRV